MTNDEYIVLRKRLKKGKEYLHREYYTTLGGKGRRDDEMRKLVGIWLKMSDVIHDYEQKNGIYPGGENWPGIEEYEKLAEE